MSLGFDDDLLYERRLAEAGRPRIFRGLNALNEAVKSRARVQAATTSHVPQDKRKYGPTKTHEAELAETLNGSTSNNQNEPFDVYVGKHAIEVKTIDASGHDRITMYPDSLKTKLKAAKKGGFTAHTVVFDTRKGKEAVYYREGLGSFQLAQMRKLPSVEAIAEAMQYSSEMTDATGEERTQEKDMRHMINNAPLTAGGMGSGRHQELDRQATNLTKSLQIVKDPKGRKVLQRRLDQLRDKMHSQLEDDLSEVIHKTGSGYQVRSEKGKNLSSPGLSKGAAKKRLAQVEYFKHKESYLPDPLREGIHKVGKGFQVRSKDGKSMSDSRISRKEAEKRLLQVIRHAEPKKKAERMIADKKSRGYFKHSHEAGLREHGVKGQRWGLHKYKPHKLDRGAKVQVLGEVAVIENPKMGYGYFKGFESSDHGDLDLFLGKGGPDAKNVYVFYTKKEVNGKDIVEPKCCVGFESKHDAKEAFAQKYDKDRILFRKKFSNEEFHDAMNTDELYYPKESGEHVKGLQRRKGKESAFRESGVKGMKWGVRHKTPVVLMMGTNGAGKSTIMKNFSERYKGQIVHIDGEQYTIVTRHGEKALLMGQYEVGKMHSNAGDYFSKNGSPDKKGNPYGEKFKAALKWADKNGMKALLLDSRRLASGMGHNRFIKLCKEEGVGVKLVRVKASAPTIVARVAARVEPGHTRNRTLEDIASQHIEVKRAFNKLDAWPRLKLKNENNTDPMGLAKKLGKFTFAGTEKSGVSEAVAWDEDFMEAVEDLGFRKLGETMRLREHGGDGTIMHPLDSDNYIPMVASKRESYAEQNVVNGEIHNNPGMFEAGTKGMKWGVHNPKQIAQDVVKDHEGKLGRSMTSRGSMMAFLHDKAEAVYNNNDSFRDKVNSSEGKQALKDFMTHWMKTKLNVSDRRD